MDTFLNEQYNNSRDFLAQWSLYKDFRDMELPDPPEIAEAIKEGKKPGILSAPRPFSPLKGKNTIGEIRLLAGMEHPQYVVILEQRGWNYLVVPFSQFDAPATDAELSLKDHGGAFLKTVQVWNARTIHFAQLLYSWTVHRLAAEDMEAIRKIRRHYLMNEIVSKDILPRIGVPVTNTDDERLEYQDEAVAAFAKIDATDFEIMDAIEIIEERAAEASKEVVDFSEKVKKFVPLIFDASVELQYAAGSEKQFLSAVYTAPELNICEILNELAAGKVPGKPTQQWAEWAEERQVWKRDHWTHGGYSMVVWDKKNNRLLALGDMQEISFKKHELYVRCESPYLTEDSFSPSNAVIFIGK